MSGKVRLYVDGAYIHNGTEVWVHDQCGESVLFREYKTRTGASRCFDSVCDALNEYGNVVLIDGLLLPA